MKLIVGLGNPGKKYLKTRHNIGWMVLDQLIKQQKLSANKNPWHENKKAKALFFRTEINNQTVELIKPITFMNNSGYSVVVACKNYNLDPKTDIIVIHDDKDIVLGKIKVQTDKNAAGHKGVQSIIEQLGRKDFLRIRVGIANDKLRLIQDTSKFVLQKFSLKERKKLKQTIKETVEKLLELI